MQDSEEEFVPEEEAEMGPAALKKLRERLAACMKEKQEYLEGWQRSRADFANFKREAAERHGEIASRLRAEAVEKLLPVLDFLEMARQHGDDSPTLRMADKQFLAALKDLGVEQYGAEGDRFDPKLFEAIDQKPAAEKLNDRVLAVRRSGYRLEEKVIRPAQVVVGVHQE